MLGYFIIDYSNSKYENVIDFVYMLVKDFKKFNYFNTTIRQYKELCKLSCVEKCKDNYKEDESKTPQRTSLDEISVERKCNDTNRLMVCTFWIDKNRIDWEKIELYLGEKKMALYEYKGMCSLSELPFVTNLNYRKNLNCSDILCKISYECLKITKMEKWSLIAAINKDMEMVFGRKYHDFLKDYAEYLTLYCNLELEKIKSIINARTAISNKMRELDNSCINLKDMMKHVNENMKYVNTFKMRVYLFHMLWNNLYLNYGYEVVYVIAQSGIMLSEFETIKHGIGN